MIKLRIEKGEQYADIRFPCEEKVITDALNRIGVVDELDTRQTVSKVLEFDSLSLLEGQQVDLDEINFLSKRLDSFIKSELDRFTVAAQMEGLDNCKDLINLTYNLHRYTLIQNFESATEVGRMHMLTKQGGITETELKTVDFSKIGWELLNSGKGKWTEKGLLFFNDDLPEEKIYNGETFPEYDYNGECLFAVKISFLNASEYVYLPCEALAIKKALARLGVEGTEHCELWVEFDRIEDQKLATLVFNSVKGEDVYDVNAFAEEMENLTETEKFLAVVEYGEAENVKELTAIAKSLDEFEYAEGVDSDYSFGEYLVDNDMDYECSEHLRDYINYEKLGGEVRRNGNGIFITNGCVYISSGKTYEEVLDKDMGMTFGGI